MKECFSRFCGILLLTALTSPLHAGKVLAEVEYFYATDNTLVGKAFNGKRVNFEYDLRGQLLAVTDAEGNDLERYTYDPAGNRLSKKIGDELTTYRYDNANQLVSSTSDGVTTQYRYDAAGRMVQAGDKTYSYLNNKVSEVRQNGNTIAKFEYNIDGQISKAVYGDKTEEFIWDGLALVWRSGVTYVNEPYITGGNPILAGDDVLFNDMLGNTLTVNEKPVEMTSFGETDNASVFFTGKPMVEELGYTFLFRDYNPSHGRWTATDPLGFPDGWNNLSYVNNSVTEAIDRFGTDIYHLVDTSSCGHSACIVGNPVDGYTAYNYGGAGSGYTIGTTNRSIYTFATPKEALAKLNLGRTGSNEYDWIQKWTCSSGQDFGAKIKIENFFTEAYDTVLHNCMHSVDAALDGADVPHVGANSSYWGIGVGCAWCPPKRFFNANILFAETLDYNEFKSGVIE